MLRRVALVRIDVSKESSASIIRVTRIAPILVTLMMEELDSSETSILTRPTRRNIPEDTIFHSHRRENLKPYTLVVLVQPVACRNTDCATAAPIIILLEYNNMKPDSLFSLFLLRSICFHLTNRDHRQIRIGHVQSQSDLISLKVPNVIQK
jgi:hypothetical protein